MVQLKIVRPVVVVYDIITGKIKKEIPVIFWYSSNEKEKENRHFNLSYEIVKLKDGEGAYILLPMDSVMEHIKKALGGI